MTDELYNTNNMTTTTQTTNRLSTKKRKTNLDTDSDSENGPLPIDTTSSSWPRFLVIESTDERSLSKLSPFAIQKGFVALAGEPLTIKKLSSGRILVEFARKAHSDNMLRSRDFVGIPIKVSPHNSLNSSKGVIRSRELEHCTETEMITNLKSQGVVAVKRITIRRNGEMILTNTFILTFNTPTLPKTIKAGYLVFTIDPFIPNPLRCFKCQRFGHHKDNCKRQETCVRCGTEGHDAEDSQCVSEPRCINCQGKHSANAKVCPKWLVERDIQSVRVTQNVSFPEARKIVEARSSAAKGQSYATVTRSSVQTSTRSVSCQTNYTWPNGTFAPIPLTPVQTKPALPKKPVPKNTSTTQTSVSEKPSPPNKTNPSKQNASNKQTSKLNRSSDRQQKGSKDPILLLNKFGPMDEMDTNEVPVTSMSKSPLQNRSNAQAPKANRSSNNKQKGSKDPILNKLGQMEEMDTSGVPVTSGSDPPPQSTSRSPSRGPRSLSPVLPPS